MRAPSNCPMLVRKAANRRGLAPIQGSALRQPAWRIPMTRCLPTVALAVLAVSATLSTGHPAAAGEESDKIDVFAARLFAGPVDKQKKTYGCFVRRYDAAHLARHPLQKVSMMKLLVTAEMLPEAESPQFFVSGRGAVPPSAWRLRLERGVRARPGVRERRRQGAARLLGGLRRRRASRSAPSRTTSRPHQTRYHPHLAQQQAGRRRLPAERRRRRSRVPGPPGRGTEDCCCW